MLISDYTTGHHEANRYGVRIYLCLIMILVAACIASSALHAQADSSQHILFAKIHSAAEEEYGIHHELVNGALFEDKYQDVIGHPYYLNYFSDKGSLVYRGKLTGDPANAAAMGVKLAETLLGSGAGKALEGIRT